LQAEAIQRRAMLLLDAESTRAVMRRTHCLGPITSRIAEDGPKK